MVSLIILSRDLNMNIVNKVYREMCICNTVSIWTTFLKNTIWRLFKRKNRAYKLSVEKKERKDRHKDLSYGNFFF